MDRDPNRFYVYQLRLDGSDLPFYIGKGSGRRAWLHLQPGNLIFKGNGTYLKIKTILDAKAAGVGVLIEVISNMLTEVDAYDMEILLISKFGLLRNKTGCLCNVLPGGQGGPGLPEESRERKRAAFLKAWAARTDEEKLSRAEKSKKSKESFFADADRFAASKQKGSLANKGVPKNPESVAKMKATKAAQFSDPVYREKVRIAKAASIKRWYANGGVNPFKGKKMSETSIEKMKATKAATALYKRDSVSLFNIEGGV